MHFRSKLTDPLSNSALSSASLLVNWDKRRQVERFLDRTPRDYVPEGWSSRELVPVRPETHGNVGCREPSIATGGGDAAPAALATGEQGPLRTLLHQSPAVRTAVASSTGLFLAYLLEHSAYLAKQSVNYSLDLSHGAASAFVNICVPEECQLTRAVCGHLTHIVHVSTVHVTEATHDGLRVVLRVIPFSVAVELGLEAGAWAGDQLIHLGSNAYTACQKLGV